MIWIWGCVEVLGQGMGRGDDDWRREMEGVNTCVAVAEEDTRRPQPALQQTRRPCASPGGSSGAADHALNPG